MANGCPVYYYIKVKHARKHVTRAGCIFRPTRRAKAHYYADRAHYACTGRVFLHARHNAYAESSGWKYLRRGIRDDYWFSARSHTFSLLHSLSGLPKPVLSPIRFYVGILKLTVDDMSPQSVRRITRHREWRAPGDDWSVLLLVCRQKRNEKYFSSLASSCAESLVMEFNGLVLWSVLYKWIFDIQSDLKLSLSVHRSILKDEKIVLPR